MLLPIVTAFEDEVLEIASIFDGGPSSTMVTCTTMPYHPADDGCIVSIWDAWSRYLRSLYLTCAAGSVVSIANTTYAPTTALTEASALTALRQAAVMGSGIVLSSGEPKWFLVTSVAGIGAALGLGNMAQIQSALSQNTVSLGSQFSVVSPLDEIRQYRNYVAHKSSAGASGLRASMASGINDISQHLRERTRGGSNRFRDWCDGLVTLAWDAAA